MGSDAAYDFACARRARNKKLATRVLEIGVAAGGVFFQLFGAQLWHEIGIIGIAGINEIDEFATLGFGCHRSDRKFRHSGVLQADPSVGGIGAAGRGRLARHDAAARVAAGDPAG